MILKASTNPRNILSHPLLGLSINKVMLDGVLFSQYKIDTVNAPYVFSFEEPKVPAWYPFEENSILHLSQRLTLDSIWSMLLLMMEKPLSLEIMM